MEVMSERIIIKLGGSLLSPYEASKDGLREGKPPFDFSYARELLTLIRETGKKFIIVIGGGYLNRWYLSRLNIEFATDARKSYLKNDLHHLGIASGVINSTIFRSIAADVLGPESVYPDVIKYDDYDTLSSLKDTFEQYKIVIASGRKPGHSHDVDALFFATLVGTNQILSFKNIDGIYSANPFEDVTAIKKKVLTWPEYHSIVQGTSHDPGASLPIDVIAAHLAEKLRVGFTVLDGSDFTAVKEAIDTRLCSRGSVISPG
jgi:uridylate kinase